MNKIAIVLSIVLLAPVSAVLADSQNGTLTHSDDVVVSVGADLGAQKSGDDVRASSSARADIGEDRSATEPAMEEENDNASSTETSVSVEHKSVVATFVASLLRDADRDESIGEEVRAVAKSQDESASTTALAMLKVEHRNAFLSFLIGTDWKNIGALRSTIAKTEADAARLKTAISQASDASVKADLAAQLSLLAAEQAKVKTFVDAHANSFSLFGWFTKLFVSSDTSAEVNSH